METSLQLQAALLGVVVAETFWKRRFNSKRHCLELWSPRTYENVASTPSSGTHYVSMLPHKVALSNHAGSFVRCDIVVRINTGALHFSNSPARPAHFKLRDRSFAETKVNRIALLRPDGVSCQTMLNKLTPV